MLVIKLLGIQIYIFVVVIISLGGIVYTVYFYNYCIGGHHYS